MMQQGLPTVIKKKKRSKSNRKQVLSHNFEKSKRFSYRRTRTRTRIDDLYNNVEAKLSVMDRTEEVLASLAPEFPSFVKCMLPSNVSYSFWLILPTEFCDLHLPRQNAAVTLVGECGREYKTNYLLERHGLSAGWRGFSIAHRLVKGDMLVFHLVGPCKLKVHIVRVYGLDEVDAALSLMNLNALRKRRRSDYREKDDRRRKKAKNHVVDSTPMDTHQSRKYIEDCQRDSNSNLGPTAVQFDNSSYSFCSEHPKDVEMTDHLQSDELSCYRSPSSQYHLHEGIGCR